MSINLYTYVDKFADLIVKHSIGTRQVQQIIFILRRKGVDACKVHIKNQVSRGYLSPEFANEIMKLLDEVSKGRVSKDAVLETLTYSMRLSDYYVIKPLVEDWQEFQKYLSDQGFNELRLEHIVRIKVERGELLGKAPTYGIRLSINKHLDTYKSSRLISSYLESKLKRLGARCRVNTVVEYVQARSN